VTTSASSTTAIRIRGILASATIDGPYREPRLGRCHPMSPRDSRLDFEGLYRTHRNEVYRAALRKVGDHHDAEDVTQTAFLDAYRAILRGSKPDLPRAWLLAIAENVRRRRFRTTLGRPRQEQLQDETLPSAEPPWRAQTEEIRNALARLAENQRKVFLLRELGGFSYSEIAVQLDLSVPAVQMLLFRARQKLRAELDQSGSVRLGGLIPVPHWLLGLADKFPAGFAAPRVAGLVAAGVIATSVGVVSDVSVAESKRQPAGHAPLVVSKPVHRQAAAPALNAVRAPVRATVGASVVSKREVEAVTGPSTRRSTQPQPTIPVVAVEGGGAESAAPAATSATLGIGGGAPAPALVPALPSVSQAPIVPVVTLHPPPLPEPPVDVVVPALPDLPIEQPPLPPALPGGVEATVPEIPVIKVVP
jgi:RNA polymerase sigma-70 factor (ECF subfamily)